MAEKPPVAILKARSQCRMADNAVLAAERKVFISLEELEGGQGEAGKGQGGGDEKEDHAVAIQG